MGLDLNVQVSLRALRRSPGFFSLAVAILTLGIGLTTALCSVVNGTIWHALPFPDPDRLVAISEGSRHERKPGPVAYTTFEVWAAATGDRFDGMAAYRSKNYTLTDRERAVSLGATVASGSLFRVLRTDAAIGRPLQLGDDHDAALVAVLGDAAWREFFGADLSVVGKTIVLNQRPFTIVGVMPLAFQFPTNAERVDVYTTLQADAATSETERRLTTSKGPRYLSVIARLSDSMNVERAQAVMDVVSSQLQRARPDSSHDRVAIVAPAATELVARVRPALLVLGCAVAVLLLIACGSVAILMLTHVTNRRTETAIRLALGAGRRRVVTELLTETVLVGLAGGLLGFALAWLGAGVLVRAAGPGVSTIARVRFDYAVLGFSLAAAVLAGALSGVIPALQNPSADLIRLVREGSGTTASPTVAMLRRGLLAAEIALTVLLLASATTLVRAYATLVRVAPGFDTKGAATFRIDVPDERYDRAHQEEFFDRLRARLDTIPGVRRAAFTAFLPFGDLRYSLRFDIPGRALRPGEDRGATVNIVSPGFFGAMGIPLLQGRDFTVQDDERGQGVVIIGDTLAHGSFADESAMGQVIDVTVGPARETGSGLTIVGIAGDVRNGGLAVAPDPQIYVPYRQAPLLSSMTFVVRSAELDAAALLPAIRQSVRSLDPSIAVVNPRSLADGVTRSLIQPRFDSLLMTLFSGSALLLSVVGLYAVVAYSAAQRGKEFCLRMALGARREDITRLMMREGLQVAVPGFVVGLLAAPAVMRSLGALVFGVSASDWWTLVIVAALTGTVTLVATYHPARSASRQDPATVLRTFES